MTLIIQKPTGAKLVLRKELPADAEADAYIAAVEAADGQALESGVKFAIKNFVLCCKQDGIWDAIKASCILAGARTLDGALVPLVGTAPTNVGPFDSDDYNRKTGLVGDGSTKYLDSNRNNNVDPQDNKHVAVHATSLTNVAIPVALGAGRGDPGGTAIVVNTTSAVFRNNNSTVTMVTAAYDKGTFGSSRSQSTSYGILAKNVISAASVASQLPVNINYLVFANINASAGAANYSDARLAFYSIGESLNLALLDARVTDLINAFAAAIP